MTDKKILVLDIDGTLVNSEKKITPETLKYLKMIQEQRIFIELIDKDFCYHRYLLGWMPLKSAKELTLLR